MRVLALDNFITGAAKNLSSLQDNPDFEFRHLDLARLKSTMRRLVIVDGRNIYDPVVMRGLGFTYRGIGRD